MSNPGIFLIQPNGDLLEMNEEPYNSEDLLQTLLAKYPSLLAGNQIDPKAPRKWLFIEREAGVPSADGGGGRWSADHLFLDQDAIPTIVEVKRSSDTRIRREVVGQMLDYAANAVVYWPADRLRERFAKTHGASADEKINEFLGGQMEPDEFWRLANKNLQDRNVRLLFVADQIPTELQRIVEFLNEQMKQTQVLAVEIKQFIGEGQTGLVPRVIGQTAEAIGTKPPTTPAPTRTAEEIIQAIREKSPQGAELAQRILDWSREHSKGEYCTAETFNPVFDFDLRPIGISTHGQGKLWVNFSPIRKTKPFDREEKRVELRERMNAIPYVNLTPGENFASTELSALDNDAVEKIKGVIASAMNEVNEAHRHASDR